MEFLRKLFADGEALTFDQLKTKIEADTGLKIVNLADGGFVSKEKHDAKITELNGTKKQLEDARAEIQSFKDMDIDGIKKKADDWEQKYEADTKALQDKLTTQQTEFAAKTYLRGFKFTDPMVEEAVFRQFMEKKFAMEGDKFLGADEYMTEMQKQHPAIFVAENPKPNTPPNPQFAPPQPPQPPAKRRTLTQMMTERNANPNTPITFDT